MERQNRRIKEEPKPLTSKDILGTTKGPVDIQVPPNVHRPRRAFSTGEPDHTHIVAAQAAVAASLQPSSPPGPSTRLDTLTPSKPANPKLSRQVKRAPAPNPQETPGRSRSNTSDTGSPNDAARRRATVAEGKAPLTSTPQPPPPAPSHLSGGFWGLSSPPKGSHSRIYSLESGKSINQIFDNLKQVFEDLDADVKVKKKRGAVKVTATTKDAEGKKSKIKVSLQESKEGQGSLVTFKNGSGKKDDEQFALLVGQVGEQLEDAQEEPDPSPRDYGQPTPNL